MTFRDLVLVLLRRWYVLAVVFAVAISGFVWLDRSGGSYVSKPIVAFMLPGGVALRPDNGIDAEGVIGFAATIAEAVNNGRPIDRYAAEDAPAYGAGVREGVRIGVPNVGGQWGMSFTRAEIAVSIVGRTEEWVKARQREVLGRILTTADREQAMRGAAPDAHIDTFVMPLSTSIEHVQSSTRDRLLALGAILAAALITGGWLAVLLDRGLRRFRRPNRADADLRGPAVNTG
ncbi:hypothetical protein FLP10_11880 [Agromyces intestinalis]|uniref:Polysaccharide chain length determinant N-terminal domain-containing protein n=1 Tax=Agromyces intestinalis TaxID=2592652 RepID=A0A5C1YIZ3_9MICO|nr:hypothetical protein [Agromyces intestinalis]QEO15037.1 hypothetical protein FLP10_11880 [Agromyces intestinalis]